jgi:hypothetical protein
VSMELVEGATISRGSAAECAVAVAGATDHIAA